MLFFALILVPLRYPFVAMSYFCFNVWNTGLLNCTLLVLYIFFLSTWLYSRKKLSNSTINFYLLWQFTLRVNMIFYINTLKASTLTDLKDTHKLITLLINMAWAAKRSEQISNQLTCMLPSAEYDKGFVLLSVKEKLCCFPRSMLSNSSFPSQIMTVHVL